MLYVFHGTDISTAQKKARTLIESLRAKRPDAAFEHIEADSFEPNIVESHLGGQGLFSNKYIVFLDRVTEKAEAKEVLPDFAAPMQESTNIFIVLEGSPNAALKKAFEKSAEKIVVCDAPDSFKKKEFNIFALGDAFGSRDAVKSWTIYRQAVENGLESESILGTLFWQAKSIALAKNGKTAAETGLNPFVYAKSKKYADNFSAEELGSTLKRLVTLYHDAHRGLVDLELGVEGLLLNIK